MQGYIKDHRQELGSDVWGMPPLYHRLWQWLKYKANHEDVDVPLRDGSKLHIRRGQHLTSVRKIALGIGWHERGLWKEPNPKTINEILKWLTSAGMIKMDSGNRQYTLITLVNWDTYQLSADESNGKVTRREPGKPKKPAKQIDDRYVRMAEYFHDKIMVHAEINKVAHLVEEAGFGKWAEEFKKIIELDKRDSKELQRVIDWATADSFWQKNILSPSKLRKQYPQLVMKMVAPTARQPSRAQNNQTFLQNKLKEVQQNESGAVSETPGGYLYGLPEHAGDE